MTSLKWELQIPKKRQKETRQEHPGILNLPLNSDEINEKIHFLQTLLHLRDV